MPKTKWSDGVAFRGRKVWIRAQVKGDKEQGPATAYAHLLEAGEPVPTTITDGKRLRAKVIEWVRNGRPMAKPAPMPASPLAELTGKDWLERCIEHATPLRGSRIRRSDVEARLYSNATVRQGCLMDDPERDAARAAFAEEVDRIGREIAAEILSEPGFRERMLQLLLGALQPAPSEQSVRRSESE